MGSLMKSLMGFYRGSTVHCLGCLVGVTFYGNFIKIFSNSSKVACKNVHYCEIWLY